jgi:hypothetical protein
MRHQRAYCTRQFLLQLATQFLTYLFIYLALPTRTASPQQHVPITVDWTLLPNPPCQLSLWEETGVPGGRHDFRQSVDFYSFRMRTGFESHWESSHWGLNLRPQRWKASALTTWPPKPHKYRAMLSKKGKGNCDHGNCDHATQTHNNIYPIPSFSSLKNKLFKKGRQSKPRASVMLTISLC